MPKNPRRHSVLATAFIRVTPPCGRIVMRDATEIAAGNAAPGRGA